MDNTTTRASVYGGRRRQPQANIISLKPFTANRTMPSNKTQSTPPIVSARLSVDKWILLTPLQKQCNYLNTRGAYVNAMLKECA